MRFGTSSSYIILAIVSLLAVSVFLLLLAGLEKPARPVPEISTLESEVESSTHTPSTTALPSAKENPSVGPTHIGLIPLLFASLEWQPSTKMVIVFRTKSNTLVKLEGYHIEAQPVTRYPKEFLTYYRRELVSRDWEKSWVAGGGGFPFGEAYGYEKDEAYIQFGIKVVGSAPSTLPL